jgi:LCP family protein required for cell wall assembly
VQNIALFGLDSRSNNDSGRSDAIIILSIDRVHNKIKLTSIARDTYVAIDGRRNDKLTHAWAYGKAKLAVKTLNQNFNMNITDYAYINFFEFTKLIDYLGGVMIDVDAAELNIMNNYYGPELRSLGFNYTNATAGYVRLNRVQALAYSRNRYTGSDVDRGNRQKEVLEAMFAQVKDTSLTKFPSLISQVLEMVHTTMSNDELMSIARWALTSSPTFEQFGLPTAACNPKSGKDAYINGVWYYIYDLDIGTELLHDFIYEEDAVSLGTTSKSRTTTTAATTTTAVSTTSGSTTTTTTTTSTTAAGSTTSTDKETSVTQEVDAATSTDEEETQTPSSTETTEETDTTSADETDGGSEE